MHKFLAEISKTKGATWEKILFDKTTNNVLEDACSFIPQVLK